MVEIFGMQVNLKLVPENIKEVVKDIKESLKNIPFGMGKGISRIDKGVKKKALSAATQRLTFLRAALGNDAGVVGAAALALKHS